MYKLIDTDIPIYFTFCIYGTNLIYYEGLLKNLKIISEISSKPNVLIGYGNDILKEYKEKYESFSFVRLIKADDEINESIMCSRILQLDMLEYPVYIFSRDADSRISERDVWCINSFIKSGKLLHIIRDHYYHRQKIMGGMCGFFLGSKIINFTDLFYKSKDEFKNINKSYGLDEFFLSNIIYNKFNKDEIYINTNCSGLLGESVNTIDIPQIDDTDFIGNVYDINEYPKFKYGEYINSQQIKWLYTQQQWELILLNRYYILNLEIPNKYEILLLLLNVALYMKDLTICLEICNEFELINDEIIEKSNKVLELAKEYNYKVISTSDIRRKPEKNEFIICYGQYPHSIECLPSKSRILYRHPKYFFNVIHTDVEYNKCWEYISNIYILNLEERYDRYFNILVELCRICAPLNRIFHYKAQKESYTGNRQQDAYIGATNNHLEVTNNFIKSGNNHCLILEDDVTFISDVEYIYKALTDFFDEKIDYDVCFLGYSKYGKINKYNDLLSLSYQNCTTSSAYLINSTSAKLVENCFRVGVDEMKKGQPSYIYCCDRYWAKLQNRNKMFLFKRKLAFQSVTYSDITNSINYTFD